MTFDHHRWIISINKHVPVHKTVYIGFTLNKTEFEILQVVIVEIFIFWDIYANARNTRDVIHYTNFLQRQVCRATNLLHHHDNEFEDKKNLFKRKNNIEFHNHHSVYAVIYARVIYSEYRCSNQDKTTLFITES